MKRKSLLICLVIISAVLIIIAGCEYKDPTSGVTVDYTNLQGNTLSGTLTKAGSPYSINNNITVPKDSLLRIEPGVEVAFSGFYTLKVEGAVHAVGAPDDFIKFGSTYNNDTYERGNWNGILINRTEQTSIFEFCRIEDGARFYQGDSLMKGAISTRGEGTSPVIRRCVFYSNGYNGVFADSNSTPLIDGCTIYYNAFSGVVADHGANPIIRNCIITGNDDYGIFALLNTGSAPYIAYNNIWDNFTIDLYGVDLTGMPGNISMDPQLSSPDSGDFCDRFVLQSHSPCIDAGDPAGQRDFDGTTADMGAFIYAQLDPSELRGALIDEGASFGTMTTEYNPYTAATDIWVSEGDTLIIDPGVQIMFEAGTELRFSFIDSGVVIAKGTESDPIVFTSSRSTGAYRGDWESIKLIGDGSTAHADTFYNCIIEYGTSVQAMSGYAHFENCMFSDIQDYVLVEKSSGAASVSCTFEMCRFENIGLAGIKILNPAGASSIKHCIFNQNEAYGIHLYNAGNLVSITNNLFLENAINGIRCENFSSPAILNNTISANSYHGINCVKNSNPTIQNNIIINNVNYGVRCQEASNPVIKFNDIYGNLSGNFNNCPSGVGKWISHGIVIQPNGHGGSGKSIELYKTMNDGRISRSFTYADSISIDLFLQGRSDVSNNHFQINIDDGEYIPGSNAFAVQYKYGEMFILKDNVTATKKNIEFGSSDWYNLIMRRSSAGDWIMLWGGEEAALTGNMSLPGETQSVFVSQNYAYLCNGSDGLNIVNVSNPASPSLTGSYNTPGSANHVFVFGNYAYVADGDSGVAIINISSRSNPQLVQRFQTPGYASALALKENYLYVAAMDSGLRVLNISNLDSIYETAHFETMGQACGLTKYGNYLYLANGDAGLKTYNVTNAASVTAAGTFDTPGYANKVSVYGNYAYVADKEGGMRIINKANPSILSETAFFVTADDSAMGVFAEGSHAYITAGNILYVIDVSYPAKPLLAAELEIQGEGLGVYGFNNYTYIASGTQGLYIADASNMPVTLQVQDALGVSDSLSISLLSLSSTGEGGLRADDILLKDEITASDILNETFDSYITFADMQNAGWSFDFTDWRNNKSDNCDQFRNICIDPMVDEDYHLLSGSPSRESGLLNIAGTDTTYTDMGAFGGADGAWTPLEFIVNPLP